MKKTAIIRFKEKFNRNDESGCWNWKASKNRGGYGMFYDINYKTRLAHRLSYEYFIGPISNGLTIDHLCRNRSCVNPKHLETVTSRENTLRGVGISAKNAIKTHCKHGHEFNIENTYFRPSLNRDCRKCLKKRSKKEYQSRVATKKVKWATPPWNY